MELSAPDVHLRWRCSGREHAAHDKINGMAVPKTVHVTLNGSGDWLVRGSGGAEDMVFTTQAEAVRAAQAAVREAGGQLHVHTADGPMRKTFTLGRSAMAKLNAIEGVGLTRAGEAKFQDFDRQDLSPSQRRAALRESIGELSDKAARRKRPSRARGASPKD